MTTKRFWLHIWCRWHSRICIPLHYKQTKNGLVRRTNKCVMFVHKVQLPLCKWLDEKAH